MTMTLGYAVGPRHRIRTASLTTLASPLYPAGMWQHPWLRLTLLLRTMLNTRWGDAWPRIKPEIRRAVELRRQVERAGWFN